MLDVARNKRHQARSVDLELPNHPMTAGFAFLQLLVSFSWSLQYQLT